MQQFGRDVVLRDAGGVTLSSQMKKHTARLVACILPEGDLIGWKKCRDGAIVKLLIPKPTPYR